MKSTRLALQKDYRLIGIMTKSGFLAGMSASLALLLVACATPSASPDPDLTPSAQAFRLPESPRLIARPVPPDGGGMAGADLSVAAKPPIIYPGTSNFVDLKKATAAPAPASPSGGGVILNFDGADIRDVAKVIFETLKQNFIVDPQVRGEVTVQTSHPLSRDQLLPTFETILRMNQAVMVREGNLYKILPAAGALSQAHLAPRLGGSNLGYQVRIVPLRYVSPLEMQAIIAPFLPEGGVLKADVARNLLILAGTAQELANVQNTIDTFDVNWLKGMSIGMFRLRNTDSQNMANELNQLLGEGSGTPVAGLLRFVPLSKLNAVLVITPQPEYLKEVATWIERLDGAGGERLYVYAVQNSQAEYMADLLNSLFNLGGGQGGSRGGDVAPGLRAGQVSSGGLSGSGSSAGSSGFGSGSSSSSSLGSSAASGLSTSTASGGASGGSGLSSGAGSSMTAGSRARGGALGGGSASSASGSGGGTALGSGGPSAGMEEVRIVADTENNTLLIWATSQNYERIVSTLQKMDVPPRQVLIEATIAEVTLTGNLQYGLQWFFNNGLGTNNGNPYTGTGSLGISTKDLALNAALSSLKSAGAFTYAVTNGDQMVRALLNTLASDSKLRVLSSPQVMVIDNQQAVIRVGDQQPVPTGATTINNVTTTGGVSYKDTGVLLDVLPRINAGGMVNMEITQEVVDVGGIDAATSQRSFLQRKVTSKVAVRSGQTLVLGGLIRDSRRDGQSGVPVLYKLPVVGSLFGTTTGEANRTELIVLITPRVVENSQEAEQVTEEIKRKMREVAPLVTPAG